MTGFSSAPSIPAVAVRDARRMLPVWVLVSAAAAGSLLLIRPRGESALRAGVLGGADACVVAEAELNAALPRWERVAARAFGGRDGSRLESSRGVLAGDAELREARALLENAARLCPTLAGAHELLADLAWWNGEGGRAHYHIAREHLRRGELDFAAIELEAALGTAPDDPVVVEAGIELAIERGAWSEADSILRTAPEEVRESAVGDGLRGWLALRGGNPSEARRHFQNALEQRPGTREWMTPLVGIYWQAGEFQAGGDWILAHARAAAVPDASVFNSAAILYMEGKSWEDALAALDAALAIQPNNVEMRVQRALCQFRLGRIQAARASLNGAFDRSPAEYRRVMAFEPYADIRGLRGD